MNKELCYYSKSEALQLQLILSKGFTHNWINAASKLPVQITLLQERARVIRPQQTATGYGSLWEEKVT